MCPHCAVWQNATKCGHATWQMARIMWTSVRRSLGRASACLVREKNQTEFTGLVPQFLYCNLCKKFVFNVNAIKLAAYAEQPWPRSKAAMCCILPRNVVWMHLNGRHTVDHHPHMVNFQYGRRWPTKTKGNKNFNFLQCGWGAFLWIWNSEGGIVVKNEG